MFCNELGWPLVRDFKVMHDTMLLAHSILQVTLQPLHQMYTKVYKQDKVGTFADHIDQMLEKVQEEATDQNGAKEDKNNICKQVKKAVDDEFLKVADELQRLCDKKDVDGLWTLISHCMQQGFVNFQGPGHTTKDDLRHGKPQVSLKEFITQPTYDDKEEDLYTCGAKSKARIYLAQSRRCQDISDRLSLLRKGRSTQEKNEQHRARRSCRWQATSPNTLTTPRRITAS